MLDKILSIIAPHPCYSCGKETGVLCRDCKNYIITKKYNLCVLCGRTLKSGNLCRTHHTPVNMIWCWGMRQGLIEKIIDNYKFRRVVAAANVLSDLLVEILRDAPSDAVLVPVSTTPKNVRIRGYDHIKLITKEAARRKGFTYNPLLQRRSNVVQHFAKSSHQRQIQAKDFFKITQSVDPDARYIIVDDIFTTGATVFAAAQCLADAGARNISIAVLVRHGDAKLK